MKLLLVIGVLGMLMGAGALGYGLYAMFDQHARLGRCRPVEAEVISSGIETMPSSHITEYKPKVRFKYKVDGALLDSERTTPGDEAGSRRWAMEVATRFPPGAKVTAYYDPRDPAYAFLVRRYDAMPYTAYLFGVLMILCGVIAIREWKKTRGGAPEPRDVGDGWYQAIPPTHIRPAARTFLTLGIVWQVLGAPAWIHYLAVREPPTPLLFVIYLPIYIAVGLLLLSLGGWAALVLYKLDDAVVLIDRPRPRTGEPLAVRVEQPVRRPLVVKEMEISLICRQVQRTWIHGAPQETSEKIYNASETALENYAAEAGEQLVADFTLLVPLHMPPSTPPGEKGKIRYTWDLNLRTRIRGWLPCPDKFMLTVEQGEVRPPAAGDIIDAEIVSQA